MTGFVYAILNREGWVKFGWSGDPLRRLAKIKSDCPGSLRLLGLVQATKAQEAELHDLLRPWNVGREWYRYEGAVVKIADILPKPTPRAAKVCEGHPLRKWRITNHQSGEQLAGLLGVARETVARWETGARKIGREKLLKVSETTGIPARELRPDLAALIGGAE